MERTIYTKTIILVITGVPDMIDRVTVLAPFESSDYNILK